jgi:hypothetical protein
MKKILIYIFILSFMISCGGSASSSSDDNKPKEKDNTSKNNTNEDETPCNNLIVKDGETPPVLPDC